MFKLGIIGCGRIVECAHIGALKSLANEVRVVAISDKSKERLEVVSKLPALGDVQGYDDYQKMLKEEKLDFVDIAVPHFLHKEILIASAQAGVNIIIEKPLATTLEEADRMLEAVEENRVNLCVLHNYRYNLSTAKALELIKEGRIGKPFLIRSEGLGGSHWSGARGYDPDWRTKSAKSGGGCLLDNGYHNIYLAREMMQSPVKSVYARVGTFVQDINVDDTAVLLLNHESGGTSNIQVSWSVKAGGVTANEVHGDKGSISFSRENRPLSLFSNRTGQWEYPELKEGFENSFAGLMHDCFEAVRKGRPMPTDGREARRNLEIIRAAYESAKTGKVIEV